MTRLSWIFTVFTVVVVYLKSVEGDVQGTKQQLQGDVQTIAHEDLDNFELPSKAKYPLQKNKELKAMTLQERRQIEVNLYELFVGICNERNIDHCHHEDILFFAALVAKGDPGCVLTCSEEQMLENRDKLPHGASTLDFIAGIGKYMKHLNENNTKDAMAINEMFRKGCADVGGTQCAEKRLLPFFLVAAGVAVTKLALGLTASYIANTSKQKSTKYLRGLSAAGSKACFSADSLVNVKTNTGSVVRKPLHSISLGDMVESVDEQSGQRLYSKVYYIEHEQQDTRFQLLRILYKDRFNATLSLGISDRHLIYATKNGQSTTHAPLTEPVMAEEVKEGDMIWIMEDGKLVPTKVTGVMTYFAAVRHPLTENHHVIVDGVHASVHILNEQLYRKLSYPLQWTFWMNPEWNRSWLVKRLVRVVQNGKEPFFTNSPTELMEYWTGSAWPRLFSSPISY